MSDLRKYIQQLYPSRANEVMDQLQELLKTIDQSTQSPNNPLWYKNLNLYVTYADSLQRDNQPAFDSLTSYLPQIKELGFNALHVLPFLQSPMVDRGFDISDFTKVRSDLGSIHDVKHFIKIAKELDLRVFMDLVFNHVSDQHIWFKKAEQGDEEARSFFITSKTKPHFIRRFHKRSAVWAEYQIQGKKRVINIAFPEHAGEIPHWREGKDGYWYYHTYYPQQLDLNWSNPVVFIELAKVLVYWAKMGFNFRLDAIPFVGKSAYKEVDTGHTKTFLILAALKAIATEINKECVFIVETYESVSTVLEYFGDTNRIQAELSYNFHLCTALWVSLILQDSRYIWKKAIPMSNIPHRSEWINFLRNHDELSFAYLSDQLKKSVSEKIESRGAPFREGFGVAGRTYSLLEHDEKRFLMAYFVLMSLSGGIAIPYGDEIGKRNESWSQVSPTLQHDTRNINRGTIAYADFEAEKSKRIMAQLAKMLQARHDVLNQYVNIDPEPLSIQDHEVFTARYAVGSSECIIFINLTSKPKKIQYTLTDFKTIIQLHSASFTENEVVLEGYSGIWLQK